MKRTEIEVGMVVAAKRGPASKDQFMAFVLDTRDWVEVEVGVFALKAPLKNDFGFFAPKSGVPVARKQHFTPRGELPEWEVDVVPLSLITGTWADFEARLVRECAERRAESQAEEEAFVLKDKREKDLVARLGLAKPRGDDDRMEVSLADLEAIADSRTKSVTPQDIERVAAYLKTIEAEAAAANGGYVNGYIKEIITAIRVLERAAEALPGSALGVKND